MSYAAMGFYILVAELVWPHLGRLPVNVKRRGIFWAIKYIVFNTVYVPAVLFFQELLFARKLSTGIMIGLLVAGQAGLFIYDRAYEYVQRELWGKFRGRLFKSGE